MIFKLAIGIIGVLLISHVLLAILKTSSNLMWCIEGEGEAITDAGLNVWQLLITKRLSKQGMGYIYVYIYIFIFISQHLEGPFKAKF